MPQAGMGLGLWPVHLPSAKGAPSYQPRPTAWVDDAQILRAKGPAYTSEGHRPSIRPTAWDFEPKPA